MRSYVPTPDHTHAQSRCPTSRRWCLGINSGPAVYSASAGSMGRGSVNANVSIVGLKFQRGTWTPPSVLFLGNGITANSVTPLAFSATGITVNSGTRTSATQLTVVISLSGSAVVGLRDVAVANPDAGWYTLANGFTVLN